MTETLNSTGLSGNSWERWPPEAKAELLWQLTARENQLPPSDLDWLIWLLLAGRGFGKTRSGAEWARRKALAHPTRGGIIAPTYADARDTCVEGPAGLLSVLPPSLVKNWNRSLGELDLTNGTKIKLFSSDTPDRLRGPNLHWAWCDELAAWIYGQATWDMLTFALRLGQRPQIVVTTTPKPVPLVRTLAKRDDIPKTRGSTFDNAANLSPAALEEMRRRYEGTRLGRQELYAEILDDIEGALWSAGQLEGFRVPDYPELQRVVVAIDPAVTSGEASDETGIIVAGRARDGLAYVLADRTCKLSPEGWASRAVAAYHEYQGDRIVGEANNGGDMVESVLRAVDRRIPYKKVTASKGKRLRAEPVAALYEKGLVRHVGALLELEEQMWSWVPGDPSPDRLDALVWALTELMLVDQRSRQLVSW